MSEIHDNELLPNDDQNNDHDHNIPPHWVEVVCGGGGIIWFFRGALTEPFQKGELDQADIEVKKIFSKAYIDKIIKF